MRPLDGVLVLDFTTLLPGPLATLMLAEAGATVVKIERPEGEASRGYLPQWEGVSAPFQLLNRGKRSIGIDLKGPAAAEQLRPLIEVADVLVEQFRPGVMERLGLGYDQVRAVKPDIVYCSISGYGRFGPRAAEAGHDLNYQAVTGLYVNAHHPSEPTPPAALVADIGGGTLPAVINILLALMRRDRSGEGAHLDIAMADACFAFEVYQQAEVVATGAASPPNRGRLTGGSARYGVHLSKDDKLIAVGALEDKFWDGLCDVLGLKGADRDDRAVPERSKAAVAAAFRKRTRAEWAPLLAAADCCATPVATFEEAIQDAHFVERGLFDHAVAGEGGTIPAAAVPVAPAFRGDPAVPVAAPREMEPADDIAALAARLKPRR